MSNQWKATGQDDLSQQEKKDIEDDFGLRADLAQADAYLLLQVPDFGEPTHPNDDYNQFDPQSGPGNNKKLTSFLRLGAFDISKEPKSALELLKLIPQVKPPGNPARDFPEGQTYPWNPATQGLLDAPAFKTGRDYDAAYNDDVLFIDDLRIRPGDVEADTEADRPNGPGHKLSREARQRESARLYSRGGWRDHSDGNRISTTYGDKVEVVRGNYKMIVMGRQDDVGEAMGWEASGSHIRDYAPGTMPGASYWLEWINDYQAHSSKTSPQGVWLLVNTTENVYEYARNAGNFREEKWGDVHESYVGSDNPPHPREEGVSKVAATDLTGARDNSVGYDGTHGAGGHEPPARIQGLNYDFPGANPGARHTPGWGADNEGIVRSNPHIIEKTWARRIDSWTGSERCSVPLISEKTFADRIESDTGSASKRVHDIRESKWANRADELVDVTERIFSNVRAGSVTEFKSAGSIIAMDSSVLNFAFTHFGLNIETNLVPGVGVHVSLEAAEVLDLYFGAKFELDIALAGEYHLIKHTDFSAKEDRTRLEASCKAIKESFQAIFSEKVSAEDRTKNLKTSWTTLKANFGI